jgi:molecular chaperone HscB
VSTCWQCGTPADSLFCPSCNALQPPPSGYYELFGMPVRLALSVDDVQQRFYALSRMLHPDRFTRRSERERQYSLEASSLLNDAWRALRDPVKRAEYVLRQNGFDIGEQRSSNVPPELLEEVFELNMALEEMRGGDESVRPQLEAAQAGFLRMRDEIDGQLETLFRQWDESGGREKLGEVRALLDRRRYVLNLVRQTEETLAPAVQG